MGFKWWTPRGSLNMCIYLHIYQVLEMFWLVQICQWQTKGLSTLFTHWFTHAVSLWGCKKVYSWCLFLQHFIMCPLDLKNGTKSCPPSQQQRWAFTLHQCYPQIGDLRHWHKTWLLLEFTNNCFCCECLLTRKWRVTVYLKAL